VTGNVLLITACGATQWATVPAHVDQYVVAMPKRLPVWMGEPSFDPLAETAAFEKRVFRDSHEAHPRRAPFRIFREVL
jgi:hypothetical protein